MIEVRETEMKELTIKQKTAVLAQNVVNVIDSALAFLGEDAETDRKITEQMDKTIKEIAGKDERITIDKYCAIVDAVLNLGVIIPERVDDFLMDRIEELYY